MKPNAERFLGRVPGKASEFLHRLKIRNGELIAIFKRVSSGQQFKNKNLENQHWILTCTITNLGGKIGLVFECEYSGQSGPGYAEVLREVGRQCRELGIKKLVACTPDRFSRNEFYESNNSEKWKLLPTKKDWEFVQHEIGEDITLMTLIHPDATPNECRGFLTKTGMEVKGKMGGRPRKRKHSHSELGPIARQMKTDNPSLSVRQIAKELNQSPTNIHRWLKEEVNLE